MSVILLKVEPFLAMIRESNFIAMVDGIKRSSRFHSGNSPGWLYDEDRKEFLKPASYEQLELFKKQGYILEGPAGQKLTRYIIKQRE